MNNDKKEMESIFEGFDEVKFDSNDRKKVFNTLKNKRDKKFPFTRLKPILISSLFGLVATVLFFSIFTDFNKEDRQSAENSEKHQTGFLFISNENYRTSLIFVLSYSPNTESLNVLSVPKSLKVPLYDADGNYRSSDKVLHSYGYGGANGTKETLKNHFTQSPPDFYMELTESEFIDFIDSIGNGEEVLAALLKRDQAPMNELEMAEEEHYQVLSNLLERTIARDKEKSLLGVNLPDEIKIDSIQVARMLEAEISNELFFYTLEEDELHEIRNSLKQ